MNPFGRRALLKTAAAAAAQPPFRFNPFNTAPRPHPRPPKEPPVTLPYPLFTPGAQSPRWHAPIVNQDVPFTAAGPPPLTSTLLGPFPVGEYDRLAIVGGQLVAGGTGKGAELRLLWTFTQTITDRLDASNTIYGIPAASVPIIDDVPVSGPWLRLSLATIGTGTGTLLGLKLTPHNGGGRPSIDTGQGPAPGLMPINGAIIAAGASTGFLATAITTGAATVHLSVNPPTTGTIQILARANTTTASVPIATLPLDADHAAYDFTMSLPGTQLEVIITNTGAADIQAFGMIKPIPG